MPGPATDRNRNANVPSAAEGLVSAANRPTGYTRNPTCPSREGTCVRRWGAAAADEAEPDLAFVGRKLGSARCDFTAYVSPQSALTAKDIADLDRHLRRDTQRRIERMMSERRADFESATLACASLSHLDDLRWRAERRERLVDRARERQQDRRDE